MRRAAVNLLEGYKAANEGSLKHVFHARPVSIFPPAGFVDSIDDPEITYTPAGTQRTPIVRIRLVRGTLKRGDTAEANDELVDGFIDYVVDNRYAAGANTLALITAVDDEDGWVPDWISDSPEAYYTTLLTLSGEGLFGGIT